MKTRIFPALLKSWRNRRGLSQLDLAMTAEMSPRHLSFLETGRSQPSSDMVLRLCAALDVPLRERNQLLLAAEHPARYPDDDDASLPPEVERVLDRMGQKHEPYPLVVLNSVYDAIRTNHAAALLLPRFVADHTALVPPLNLFDMTFDPRLSRPFVVDWDGAARDMIARLHREVLAHPGDARRADLLARVLTMPNVPKPWHQPDFDRGTAPVLGVTLQRNDVRLSFVAVVTSFSGAQHVAVDELRIEAWFPTDDATERYCAELASL
jgi:transcriptional regulator with XRE-family HTH domain